MYFMTSFFAHASSKDGVDFEASGRFYATDHTITGHCDIDCDGNISVDFIKVYSANYDTEYFYGHLDKEGSLVGTMGFDENRLEHQLRFILKRTPDEIMCYRPSPVEFLENKPRALWKFAIQAIRTQVLKERWAWRYFAQRRDRRQYYMKSELRLYHYGRPLDDEETEARRAVRQAMTSCEASFCRSIFEYQLRIMPAHV